MRINEISERRNRLLNELLRSSLDNQVECDLENYISYENSLEKQSSRVQSLFNNPKKYDIGNIISLDSFEDECDIQLEGDSINNNDENEATVEVRLDGSCCQSENYMEIGKPEEILRENEPILEFDNDHLNIEQGLEHKSNDSRRNKRMRFALI
jgi:hypothetical protein